MGIVRILNLIIIGCAIVFLIILIQGNIRTVQFGAMHTGPLGKSLEDAHKS